jgi:Zn-dependent M28 family amino/carboxypeptidase
LRLNQTRVPSSRLSLNDGVQRSTATAQPRDLLSRTRPELLDLIASLKKSPKILKRSLLFVFVTGEEKGLLGARCFTTHPTVKPGSMIANINIDMFLPIVRLKVLTVYGLAESDMGDMTREVAQSLGVQVQADPEPQRNAFIRSDQYNFIRHGVPALAMGVGFEKGAPQQEIFKNWRMQRYHAPSDDLDQPWIWR